MTTQETPTTEKLTFTREEVIKLIEQDRDRVAEHLFKRSLVYDFATIEELPPDLTLPSK